MCVSVGERDSVCVFVISRMLATLIHKAFRTCFRRLFLCHHLSGCQLLVHRPDSMSASCVDQSLHAFFSTGISLLVPHGGIAEDTTWEMNMIINREDSRWGGGAVCIFGCSPLILQSITERPVPIPVTSSSSCLSQRKRAHRSSHTENAQSHIQHAYSADASIFPPSMRPLLIM